MGFDLNRVLQHVHKELLCPLCHGLLNTPVQLQLCEHLFCIECLQQYTTIGQLVKCPEDGQHSEVIRAPKVIQHIINRINIFCQFRPNGCQSVATVEQMPLHVKSCQFIHKVTDNGHKETDKNLLSTLESRVKSLEEQNLQMHRELNAFSNWLGLGTTFERRGEEENRRPKGKVIIKMEEKTVVIDADTQESIAKIKEKAQKMENMESEEMMVFMANKELEDDKSLIDYRIFRLHNPLVLFLVKKKIRLLVKIDRQKSYPLEMCPKDTVADVLTKILKKEAFESKDLVLCYRNQVLEESRTLFSYKIREGNFLFLNTRTEVEERKVSTC